MVTVWGGQLKSDRPFNLSDAANMRLDRLNVTRWAEAAASMGAKTQVLK